MFENYNVEKENKKIERERNFKNVIKKNREVIPVTERRRRFFVYWTKKKTSEQQ